MSAVMWLIGLVSLVVVLFLVALIKPYFAKTRISLHSLKDELAKELPHHDFLMKQGEPSRIIVSKHGIQKAIVIMDKHKPDYMMGGLPIFTTNKLSHIKHIADKIRQRDVVMN